MLVRQAPPFRIFNRHAHDWRRDQKRYPGTSSQELSVTTAFPVAAANGISPTTSRFRVSRLFGGSLQFGRTYWRGGTNGVRGGDARRRACRPGPPQLGADADGAGRVGAVGVTDGDLPGAGEVAGAGAWLVDGCAGVGDGRSVGEVLGVVDGAGTSDGATVGTSVVGVGTGVTAGAAGGRTRM